MADLSLDLNKLSPTYLDLLMIDGDLVFTNDLDQRGANPVLQNVLQALRFGLGEWFLDNTKGFPWVQRVFVKGTKLGDIDALIQNTILAVPGMVSLTTYSSTIDAAARGIRLSFTGLSTSGRVDYSGTISPTSGGQ